MALPENREHLVPERLVFAVAVMFRWRRLRRAHGVRRREAVHQPGFKLFVDFPIGLQSLTGVGGMLVMRRGIEFLSHVSLHRRINVLDSGLFHFSPWPSRNLRVSEAEISSVRAGTFDW